MMPFYAVAKGKTTGIFDSWDTCQAEVNGYPGAIFKKFKTRELAEAFMKSKTSNNDNPSPPVKASKIATLFDEPPQRSVSGRPSFATTSYGSRTVTITKTANNAHYAVAKGNKPGIYDTWKECQEAIEGFKYAKYRKFDTYDEAKKFIEENRVHSHTPSSNKRNLIQSNETEDAKRFHSSNNDDIPVVYTDGACSNNGKTTAKAGYGVYWGDDHPDNVSAPVSGEPTNNRAEYEAVYVALKQAKEKGLPALIIRTDSNLLVSSMTMWIKAWKRNNWIKSDGKPVKNRDLLEGIESLRNDVQVEFQHVRGHAGIHGNEMADQLAVKGAKQFTANKPKALGKKAKQMMKK